MKELHKMLTCLSSPPKRKLEKKILTLHEKPKMKLEGQYSPRSDTVQINPNPDLAKALARRSIDYQNIIWVHEMDHFSHFKASIAGFLYKEYDLSAKRTFLTKLLFPEAYDSSLVMSWIETFEDLREGILQDSRPVLEGSATMMSLERMYKDAINESIYNEYEASLKKCTDQNAVGYRLTNRIRMKFGRLFVPLAVQIALDNSRYPAGACIDVFRAIADLPMKNIGLVKKMEDADKLMLFVLEKLNLKINPHRDIRREFRKRMEKHAAEMKNCYQGLVSWYFLVLLELWVANFSIETLERTVGLRTPRGASEEDKRTYVTGLPRLAVLGSDRDDTTQVLQNPYSRCPIYEFFYVLDEYLDSRIENFKQIRENSAAFDYLRRDFGSFLEDTKRVFEKKYKEPHDRTLFTIFPEVT